MTWSYLRQRYKKKERKKKKEKIHGIFLRDKLFLAVEI